MSILAEIIKAEVAAQGAIPFARFMELALYCPDYGFYEKESDTVGRGGDFYTSVSVGSLFGGLLAFQFADWLEQMEADQIQIVEAGAHDGTLAADILCWLSQNRPHLFPRVQYIIAEPSARRREWQQKKLQEFAEKVRWIETGLEHHEAAFTGVIFANELLDAMPTHRLGWNALEKKWFEWGVTWEAGRFVWTKLSPTVALEHFDWLPSDLLAVLPDGFTSEICPAAESWWARAAKSLRAGHQLTLDYGLVAEDFFAPQRPQGTLRAYRRHRSSVDLLADVGEQDLTAHVNFTRIQRAGEAAGLSTKKLVTQAEFIVGIAQRFWPAGQTSANRSAQQIRELQTLLHPEHLGRAFKVLVQSR